MIRLGGFLLRVDAVGGKVRELIPVELGHNVLVAPAAPFAIQGVRAHRFEVAGWDEAFPTVAASGPWPELGWAWQTDVDTACCADSVRSVWRMPGVEMERILMAEDATLKSSYRFKNVGEAAVPFVWAGHVLYSVEGLAELDMPDGELVAGPCCLLPEVEAQVARSGGRARMRDFSDNGLSWKFFVAADGPLWLRFSGFVLGIETTASWFGIFLNRGRFGQPCLGVEPTSHATDFAAEAGVLAADEQVEYSWSLRVGA